MWVGKRFENRDLRHSNIWRTEDAENEEDVAKVAEKQQPVRKTRRGECSFLGPSKRECFQKGCNWLPVLPIGQIR